MINLCGKLAHIPMNVSGTSTEEDFEIIKFIEDNTPFNEDLIPIASDPLLIYLFIPLCHAPITLFPIENLSP
jgi:hypothetical protein